MDAGQPRSDSIGTEKALKADQSKSDERDNGQPTPIAAMAYSKILRTSFGMADLDKVEDAGALAEPIQSTVLGEVRASMARLFVFAVAATTLAP